MVKIGTTHNLGSSLRGTVGYLTRPVSYKTILGRLCLGAMLKGWQLMKSAHHSMSYILLLSRPVLSRPLSSETLVWLLSVVTYSDSLTKSQTEVPLEWIHAFYWEMGPFIPPFAILKPKVERF